MLPLPEGLSNKIDNFYRKKKLKFISFVSVLIITVLILFLFMINKGLKEGPDLSSLRKIITYEILDSCALGLERFHNLYGTYPRAEGKYFLDSIKMLVYIPTSYIFPDSANGNNFMGMMVKIKRDSLLKINNLFIGISRPEQYITYVFLTPNSYFLYSVGENGIDEHGKGDDMVYRK
jgi:hypothetical protein